ncbi:MAG: TIGR02206 family membrane protein [Epulopiscium sp.]|nr:TIGR02206 family membrane protein [Candidatus Epulonipiscium sp.]
MRNFFGESYIGKPFEIFSSYHILLISIIFISCIIIYLSKNKLRKEKVNTCFRYTIGTILLLEQSLLYLWYHINNSWTSSISLPLNLCEAAVILSIFLLITKSYLLYEILYFWGMTGVLAAIITPDINGYNHTHFIFYHFFITHGLVIISVLFMTFVNKYRPKAISIIKVMGITNSYMVFVAFINIITGGNYLFICSKPQSASIMDYLGPWPLYIISLEIVALIGFTLLYLPFSSIGIQVIHFLKNLLSL